MKKRIIAILLLATLAVGGCQNREPKPKEAVETASSKTEEPSEKDVKDSEDKEDTEKKETAKNPAKSDKAKDNKESAGSQKGPKKKESQNTAKEDSKTENKKAENATNPQNEGGLNTETEQETVQADTPPDNNRPDANTGGNYSQPEQTHSAPTPAPTQQHTHNWEQRTHTVHHEATGHTESYLVSEAWEETVTEDVYDPWECCNVCGADCTSDPGGHTYAHAVAGEGGGCHTEYFKTVQTTVYHEAVYGERWVEDSPARDEIVVDGYVCACGASK